MRFGDVLVFEGGKDGGPKSKVFGLWLIRIKQLFTIALLCFHRGSREAYHSHAFNSISWVLKGRLEEYDLNFTGDEVVKVHTPSLKPIITNRNTFHKVYGVGEKTWVFTIRGPWRPTWQEFEFDDNNRRRGTLTSLTHDRKIVAEHAIRFS